VDGDWISKILELDENAKTCPDVSHCELGTAELGNCELEFEEHLNGI